MLEQIDHVGIAVNNLDDAIGWYHSVAAATVEHREIIEYDGVEEAMLAVGDGYVQLLAAVREDSPVARFIARRGEGLHHVGYRVNDCAAALAEMVAAGAVPIDKQPRVGTQGAKVAFLHPKGSFGTLIELIER